MAESPTTRSAEVQRVAEYSYFKRRPFIMSSALSLQQAFLANSGADSQKAYQYNLDHYSVTGFNDMVVFAVNPSEMTITPKMRGAYDRARGATVYHDWISGGSRDSTLEVGFTFQSGHMLPHWKSETVQRENWLDTWISYFKNEREKQGRDQASGEFVAPFGQEMHARFMQLIAQPRHLADGTENHITIETTSRLFPNLTLQGFFDPDSIGEVTLSADDPNQFTWTATFIATGASPGLSNASDLRQQYRTSLMELVSYQNLIGQLVPTNLGPGDEDWVDALVKILSGDISFSTASFTSTGAWSAFVPDINFATENSGGSS